ncbi:Double zinc ribbon [Sedimentisphaera cyanobacteriorum]|uniref:Double zinc ribbon n=1 Tax=Sedimentisphaera cyanobacteriorum TaxID=1940790 RepID=A0A1Q2HRX2_9BACT|nr:zinc ribbon domain-containing protein [Sedimentisphaera cyanobacteriorum]AQQ10081.1 Double zinc ribbon [Sedimentisphaera cyanobacteriorum]
MYCSKCGKQISDDARFCDSCGTPTAVNTSEDVQASGMRDTCSPSIRISPTFNPVLSVVSFIPLQLFLTA